MAERRLVVGVGNTMRGDDAVGPAVAAAVRRDDGVEVVMSDGDPGELIDLWEGADRVVIVDAMASGKKAGDVSVLDASNVPLPSGMRLGSSHHFGVAAAVELARALGRLPPSMIVVGVEGAAFEIGTAMSPVVTEAVPRAVAAVEAVMSDA